MDGVTRQNASMLEEAASAAEALRAEADRRVISGSASLKYDEFVKNNAFVTNDT